LVARKGLTPAQIQTAVRFARLTLAPEDAASPAQASRLETLIERQLAHADVALGQHIPLATRRNATIYSLSMLNVESRFDVPRIVAALQGRSHGSLCFYGPPGTGKTALAEHIAQTLGQPLLVRQASDLMSKYVGETEQNMAAMFAQARAEKAVLLLDEADSFLQDRRGAQRSHEVTEVNEMLQGMERHTGIFICTTNLIDSLDQAALRRFSFKLRFMPLTTTQREAMFAAEVGGGAQALLDPTIKRRLAQLTALCPGDFAAIQRQAEILDCTFSAEDFLTQLEAEHRIKPEVRETRDMGFLP
jgi:SpoVK/Ycf46/Vps4 family AAA+-type ATPase